MKDSQVHLLTMLRRLNDKPNGNKVDYIRWLESISGGDYIFALMIMKETSFYASHGDISGWFMFMTNDGEVKKTGFFDRMKVVLSDPRYKAEPDLLLKNQAKQLALKAAHMFFSDYRIK